MSSEYSYRASSKQLSSWYGATTQLEIDDNDEPTAADHGDVLYTIGQNEITNFDLAERHNF